jgi:biopolymer transport protein ExbD
VAKGPEMDLSSFMDIMTCILGILILIILLTGIDATQIKVLVATPQEDTDSTKRPVFFECRNNQLFFISFDNLKAAVDEKTEEIRHQVEGNETEFLRLAGTTRLEIDGQFLDYTFAMLGRYVLTPDFNAQGYAFTRYTQEKDDMWFGRHLNEIDPATQFLCFFVRPDSFTIFQQARLLAWLKNISVTCELLDERSIIDFGAQGIMVRPQ